MPGMTSPPPRIPKPPLSTLVAAADRSAIEILDQGALPHEVRFVRVTTLAAAAHAISAMQVRGAPLIGVAAAYGLALALTQCADDAALEHALSTLAATRPTAVNLAWALARLRALIAPLAPGERAAAAWGEATNIAREDAEACRRIGEIGLELLRPLAAGKARLNVMTHCNAGALATLGTGTALAPVYAAAAAGIPIHVWVSETRPRNQGLLTAWELAQGGIQLSVIADNAAGLLMASGKVDAVIVGADRIAANGDTANKVGTYLKALAARAAGIPFYVAAPGSTLDFACAQGGQIPIEARDGDELRIVTGLDDEGKARALRALPAAVEVCNPAFDVTPAGLVSAIITERGACPANAAALRTLYPEANREAHV